MGDMMWGVEEILAERVSQARLEYLVKWENYPLDQATWEPGNESQHSQRSSVSIQSHRLSRPHQTISAKNGHRNRT